MQRGTIRATLAVIEIDPVDSGLAPREKMRYLTLVTLLLLTALSACSQAEMMKKMTPAEDERTALGYIDSLRHNQYQEIEKDLDPSIQSATMHDTLVKMAGLMPPQEPLSVKVVGVNTSFISGLRKSNITFEYQYPTQWLLINLATQKAGNVSTIIGFNVKPIPDSLESLNGFKLSGKNSFQYGMLALAILVPVFSLYALIVCIRTRMEKRKWLWVIFILLGIGKLSVNWGNGQWNIMPLSFQLFGASAVAQNYGPWMLSVSVPLGAILFLLRRKKSAEPPSGSSPDTA